MHRRAVALALTVVVLSGCSADPEPIASLPPPSSPPVATTAAPLPAGTAPTRSFTVDTRTLELRRGADRPLPTTVWVPEGDGPFPLILFSHGLGGRPADYRELLTAWTRAGFVVAAPAYPFTSRGVEQFNVLDVLNQPADASYVITRTLAAVPAADEERVAAAGHSAGGVTTLGLFSNARDVRLRAGVVLAGRQVLPQPFTGPAAPMLFVHGRKDATVAYSDGRAAYDAVKWPKAFVSVTDGGHTIGGRALGIVTTTSTDFWRWTLYGDESARDRLKSDATRGKIATYIDDL
ncbi:alpha/beta hydrolase family protein [Paractinoplanes lichenicola]|uniref:Chlorophyllase n=1 Tax=Paractinoplanes lichenicola TaxID=2802976 RepID=A0ABS1VK70_9ACTN|nr:chlorophyllase [Actinoplanes lichenicola]MBL7255049.1 chlorophyllase [Actinoplanes lichenicola]